MAYFSNLFQSLKEDYHTVFIVDDRYTLFIDGIINTMIITAGALVIGLLIGILVAAVRSTYDKNKDTMRAKGGIGYILLSTLNAICKVYLTIIRGTPVVVQLMISFFIIFATSRDPIPVGIFAFGINSGAYVAEIFRGGIMSIDVGQFEAGRSVGLNYFQTMRYIIVPQMFKSVLPTLCNEVIALLKETSVVGYVGVIDLTKAGDLIAGSSFNAFMPLLSVAAIYLVIVMIMSMLVSRLERRLRKSDH